MSKDEKDDNEIVEPTIDDDALAAAVSDAVDEVTYTEVNESEEEEREDDDTTGGSEDNSESGADDGSESGSDADEEDSEKSGDGESEDEKESADDGKTGEGADGDDAAKGGDKGGDGKDGGDESTDKPDHLNDPIPEGTNERTRQRIQSLISDVKELSTARDERDGIMEAITQSGATPDQYAGALGLIKLYNSDNIEHKKQALEAVRKMERDLAFEVGETGGLVKLEDYPDLQAEVEAGNITEKYALEIAGTRARDKHLGDKRQQQSEAKTEQQRTQDLIEQGKKGLNTLGNELKSDPAYGALYAQFTSILNSTLRHVHPTEWVDTAREIFGKLKSANPTAGLTTDTTTNGKGKKHKPLRPKSGSSGSGKKSDADSALDAMNEALDGV